MDVSAPNSLNRSVAGLWARKTRLNLNSTPPQSSAVTNPTPNDSTTNTENAAPASTSTPAPEAPIPVKRKSRAADPSGSTKRHKSSLPSGAYMGAGGGSSSTKEKDYSPPSARLSDLGGVGACVDKILELVALPICHPEVYVHTGVQPPRGVLLHGPPGCGKTLLANAIAGELGVPFISISAPSIVSGMSGESERTLRETFEEAQANAPSILFIDEIDAITPKRESAQREMERRIVAQFLTCMDSLTFTSSTSYKPVIVIGATNRPDSLDSALRRAGRFDHEIAMSVPDAAGREQILRVMCEKMRLEGSFDFGLLARATPGFVGADLSALTSAAGVVSVKRIFRELAEVGTPALEAPPEPTPENGDVNDSSNNDEVMAIDGAEPNSSTLPAPFLTSLLNVSTSSSSIPSPIASFLARHPDPLTLGQLAPLVVTQGDFTIALTQVQPSSKREGFATIPNITWNDVGALHDLRAELESAITLPIRFPEVFKSVGITQASGVLLWGPPGCGKTLLAKAVAGSSQGNFISVKGPELLNKYVGESEKAVRQLFARAAASSPCIIFFDELDALVPRRDDSMSDSSARVVNTLLTELDGLASRKDVYVIAATNRPDMIDPAMCRPGRLDKLLYVDLPNSSERGEILRTMARKLPFRDGLTTLDDVVQIVGGSKGEGYSGADLAAIVREAGVFALEETLKPLRGTIGFRGADAVQPKVEVTVEHFSRALDKVSPSVSVSQRKGYERLRSKFSGLPVTGGSVRRAVGGIAGPTPMADDASPQLAT